jgi:hypothetical protein
VTVALKRRTQTAEYWLEEFVINKEDVLYLYEWLVEESEPRTIHELSLKVIERRCLREEEALLKRGDSGAIYQPQDEYKVGQRLVFPAFDYVAAEVLAVRDGNNPRYGPFRVIKVQLENESSPREFAAALTAEHALTGSPALLQDSDTLLATQQLYELYGATVREHLQEALAENEDFVHFGDSWYLRGLVPEVTAFHLNIAEAMIYERAQPLTIAQLLQEVDFPPEIKPAVQVYALSHALSQDSRFTEVSVDDEPAWFLKALVPDEVREMPVHLAVAHATHGREWLNRELRDFALELADEADALDGMRGTPSPTPAQAELFLTYPHRREGTLPLNASALALVSERPSERFMITFVDRRHKEEMQGWMMPSAGYAWGLGEWYARHNLPIGAVIELAKDNEPFTFVVGFEEGRAKTDWIRQARITDGRVTFSMQRKSYTCAYDKHLLIDEGSVSALDALWTPVEEAQSLFGHLIELFPELAKLSGLGQVHAKTLYSAVNLTRRCGAVPIFAELTRQACFDPVGDGNWVYDESLRGAVYNTPEDMSRRPSSQRAERIVDRVYRYAMNDEV